jgi:bacterioferritin-associated ferredoxin
MGEIDLNQGQPFPVRQIGACPPGDPVMIICSCNVFSDQDVRAVITLPRTSMAQVYRRLGQEPRCGRCTCTIREIMNEQRQPADN